MGFFLKTAVAGVYLMLWLDLLALRAWAKQANGSAAVSPGQHDCRSWTAWYG